MITIDMSSGNFNLVVRGELSATAQADILAKGLKYEVERDVLSSVYKELAGIKGKRGKLVLPKGFERDSVEYTDENSVAFSTALKDAMDKLGTFTVSVTRYVKGETSESRKRATAMYEAAAVKPGGLDKLAAAVGYDDDVDDMEHFVERIHEWVMDPLS